MKNLSYCYKITHKTTGQFYIGYRCANKVQANLDLGIKYFTSSGYVKELGFENFKIDWIEEFDNPDQAYKFEQLTIKEYWQDNLNLNMSYGFGLNRNFKTSNYSGLKHHCKDSVWITDGKNNIKIYNLDKFILPTNFYFGRILKNTWAKDRIWITNGIDEFIIRENDFCLFDNSFYFGRLPMKKEQKDILSTYVGELSSGYQSNWINNGKIEEKIYPDINYKLPDGYKFGRLKASAETILKCRSASLGENNPMYGRKWINNGIKRQPIYLTEDFIMPEGWKFGMKIK